MLLQGKTALVTGASRGIGQAVAIKFASEGADVILLSRHKNESVIKEIAEMGVRVLAMECDVSKADQVAETISLVRDEYEKIDILANIAGISPKHTDGMKIKCYEQSIEQWREVIDTNLNSMFYISHEIVPVMMKNKYGRIINMSSVVGLTNSEHGPASAAYVTSKTGVVGLTRAMAYDLAEYGITVNAIAAGRIETDMSAANNQYYNEFHHKLIPMHRFGSVDEVAELFLFYASDKSSYITGETTNITGGWFI